MRPRMVGIGSAVALIGVLWFGSLLNDIQTIQHQLSGSSGGLIAGDGVLALFVALPLAVAGAVVAVLGFLLKAPAETLRPPPGSLCRDTGMRSPERRRD